MAGKIVDVMTGEETEVLEDLRTPEPDPPRDVMIRMVKREAQRRILAIVPAWKQRNLLAQATILAKKGEANWTAQEQAAWAAGEAIWTQVAAIRAASDVIEALDPIPTDFDDDARWP